jgi:hypothetical protein
MPHWSVVGHVWTTPRCKKNLTLGLRSGAGHVSGLFARHFYGIDDAHHQALIYINLVPGYAHDRSGSEREIPGWPAYFCLGH